MEHEIIFELTSSPAKLRSETEATILRQLKKI